MPFIHAEKDGWSGGASRSYFILVGQYLLRGNGPLGQEGETPSVTVKQFQPASPGTDLERPEYFGGGASTAS